MAYTSTQQFDANSKSLTENADSIVGEGGEVLALWKKPREDKINSLSGASFTNNSSFATPAAYYGSNGFQPGTQSDTERFTGRSARGTFLKADGTPLSGDASIESGGDTLATQSGSGVVIVSASPPTGIKSGSDVTPGQTDFRFTPSTSGLDVFTQGIGTVYDAGVVQYGAVSGTVTDYGGNPLEGRVVEGSGAFTKTDANGDYTLNAPGGTQVDLNALGATATKTPSGGQTITVDFQAARLTVEVVTPELDPVVGTTVEVEGVSYETDEDGKIRVDPARIESLNVTIGQTIDKTADIQNQGEDFVLTVGDGDGYAGVEVKLKDASTGRTVSGADVRFGTLDLYAVTDGNGVGATVAPTSDLPSDGTVTICSEDRRYTEAVVTVSASGGSVVRESTSLDRRTGVSDL